MKPFDWEKVRKKTEMKQVEPMKVESVPYKAPTEDVVPKSGTELMNSTFDSAWNLSDEEVAKRQRRATTAAAIGNLGNVMNAFANLYYVNKGAPSQQISAPVIPDYMTLQDRVTQARKDARAEQLAREKMALDAEYKDASMAYKYANLERLMALDKVKIANAEKTGDLTELKILYQQLKNDLQEETNPLQMQYLRTRIANIENSMQNRNIQTGIAQQRLGIAQQNANTSEAREARLAGGSSRTETNNGLSKTVETTWNNAGGSGQGAAGGGGKGKGYGTQNKNNNKGRGY